MRDNDLTRIVACWFGILESRDLTTRAPALINRCFTVMSHYVGWILLHLIVTQSFSNIALTYLTAVKEEAGAGVSNCNLDIACAALTLLTAIVEKKMDAARKVVLIREFGFIQILSSTLSVEIESEEYLADYTKLVNALGCNLITSFNTLRCAPKSVIQAARAAEALGGWFPPLNENDRFDDLALQGWNMSLRVLQPATTFFSHPSVEVSESVEPFFQALAKEWKGLLAPTNTNSHSSSGDGGGGAVDRFVIPEETLVATIRPFLKEIMKLLLGKVKFPEWYPHEDTDDADDDDFFEFLQNREVMTKLYKRFFFVEEVTGLQFVEDMVSQLVKTLNSGADCDFRLVEAALHLFHTTGEHYKSVKQFLKDPNHTLSSCMRALVSCKPLVQHSSADVQVLVLDIFRRYAVFFEHSHEYVNIMMEQLLGPCGLSSMDTKVVAQSSVILLKLVKSSLTSCLSFADFLIQNLRGFLVNDFASAVRLAHGEAPPAFAQDDRYRVYNVVGLLFGTQNTTSTFSAERKKSLFWEVGLGPLCAHLNDMSSQLGTCATQEEYESNIVLVATHAQVSVAVVANWVASVVNSMANLSKGFTESVAATVSDEWLVAINCCEKVFQSFSHHQSVRTSLVFFCRRLLVLGGSRSADFASPLASIIGRFIGFMASAQSVIEFPPSLVASRSCTEPQLLSTRSGLKPTAILSPHSNGSATAISPSGGAGRSMVVVSGGAVVGGSMVESSVVDVSTAISSVEIYQLAALLGQVALDKRFVFGVFCYEIERNKTLWQIMLNCFFRIWNSIIPVSTDVRRDKLELLQGIYQILQYMSSEDPATLISLATELTPNTHCLSELPSVSELLTHRYKGGEMTSTHAAVEPRHMSPSSMDSGVEVVQLLLVGAYMIREGSKLSASIYGMTIQIFNNTINYILTVAKDTAAADVAALGDVLNALCVETALQRMFSSLSRANWEDAQTVKHLQELCVLIRTCGSVGAVQPAESLAMSMRLLVSRVFVNEVACMTLGGAKAAEDTLCAIFSAPNAVEAKNALKKAVTVKTG
eukprot:Lankesteria_metandrocarpae@DN4960_c1_g1_i1.p1